MLTSRILILWKLDNFLILLQCKWHSCMMIMRLILFGGDIRFWVEMYKMLLIPKEVLGIQLRVFFFDYGGLRNLSQSLIYVPLMSNKCAYLRLIFRRMLKLVVKLMRL
jgi:hypothetical protein